jgi:hypothetical protein
MPKSNMTPYSIWLCHVWQWMWRHRHIRHLMFDDVMTWHTLYWWHCHKCCLIFMASSHESWVCWCHQMWQYMFDAIISVFCWWHCHTWWLIFMTWSYVISSVCWWYHHMWRYCMCGITCDVITCDVITCDVITCDVITCDVITCDVITCSTITCDTIPRDALWMMAIKEWFFWCPMRKIIKFSEKRLSKKLFGPTKSWNQSYKTFCARNLKLGVVSRSQCYKKIYVRNFRIFVIS